METDLIHFFPFGIISDVPFKFTWYLMDSLTEETDLRPNNFFFCFHVSSNLKGILKNTGAVIRAEYSILMANRTGTTLLTLD